MAAEGGPQVVSMVCRGKVNSVAMMRKETELTDRDHQLEPMMGAPGAALGAPGAALGAPGAALEVPGMAAEGRDVEVPPNPEEVIEDTIGIPRFR